MTIKIASVLTQFQLMQRRCLPITAILMVLLALGPFLHAHYGSSRLLGFHVDGIAQAHEAHHTRFDLVSVSQDGEEESAAVGVTTSHARQSLQGSEDEVPADVVATVVVVFAVVSQPIVSPWQGQTSAWHAPSTYALGFPPPAHAPPTLTI